MWTLTLLLLYFIYINNALIHNDINNNNYNFVNKEVQGKRDGSYIYKVRYFVPEVVDSSKENIIKEVGYTNINRCYEIQHPWSSFLDKSRRKRSAKIYPKTSVLIWKRRSNNNSNQLNVRRKSINKLRFELAHSPGIKSQVKNTDPRKTMVKRSIKPVNDSRRYRKRKGKSRTPTAKALRRNKNRQRQMKRRKQIKKAKFELSRDPKRQLSNSRISKHLIKRSIEESNHSKNDEQTSKLRNTTLLSKRNQRDVTRDSFEDQSAGKDVSTTLKNKPTYTSSEVTVVKIESTKSSLQNHENVTKSDMLIEAMNNQAITSSDETISEQKKLNQTTTNWNNIASNRNTTELTYTSLSNRTISTVDVSKLAITSLTNTNQSLTKTLTSKTATTASASTTVNDSTDEPIANPNKSSNTSLTDENKSLTLNNQPKFKQVKPNPKAFEWIKSNTHTLAVISVPLRNCPRGMRMRKGKCVNIY